MTGQCPQTRAEELVDTLVDMQLLDVAGRDATGALRYRFHDLLRAYAREVVAAEEPEADRLAALDRAFGSWLTLVEEAGRCMASSAFAVTFESGTCWRPDESVVSSLVIDPSGWFKTEWAALVGAVDQVYSVESDQHGWALGVRLASTSLDTSTRRYPAWKTLTYLRELADRRSEASALRKLDGVRARQGMGLAALQGTPHTGW